MATIKELGVKFSEDGLSQIQSRVEKFSSEFGRSFDGVVKRAQAAGREIGQAIAKGAANDADIKPLERQLDQQARRIQSAVTGAFRHLGVRSSAELDKMRRNAMSAFEAIRDSGIASAEDIERAWEATQRRLKQIDQLAAGASTQQANALSKRSERIQTVFASATRLGGLLAGALAIRAAATELIQVNREFGKLQASLVTVTGSAEEAEQAFRAIESLAIRTPFSVAELTEAFIKLRAFGLEASEEAIISFGNTAAGTGKSLDQFIEAVADAATFQFERLREFGIVARQEADKVAFTFRGVTVTVGKNAQEIIGYLERIGQTEFAGAMERQAESLDGALNRAGEAIERLSRTIGEAGLTRLVIGLANAFATAVDWANRFIDSLNGIEDRKDLGGIREEIASINDEILAIADKRAQLQAKLDEFARQGIATVVDNSAIQKLNQQIDELEARRERLIKQARALDKPLPGGKPGGTTSSPDSVTGTQGKIRDAIQSTIDRLQVQAATLGMSATEAELYKLKLEGATEAQLEAARVALEAIEAYRQLEEQRKNDQRAAEEAAEAEKRLNEQLEQAAEQVRDVLDPMRPLQREMANLKELFDKNKLSAEEFAAAVTLVKQKMAELAEGANAAAGIINDEIKSALGDAFFDVATGAESAGDAVENMAKRIHSAITKLVAQNLAEQLFKSIFGEPGKSGSINPGEVIASFLGFKQGGLVNGYADGGLIAGPGTGTSDSIAAAVPAGSFVLKAAAVRRYGVGALNRLAGLADAPRGADQVPVKVSNGEYLFGPGIVNRLGRQFFDRLNGMRISQAGIADYLGSVQRYATGGLVLAGGGSVSLDAVEPARKSGGNGNGAVNLNMTVMTPDANSFRKSEGQLGRDAAIAFQRSLARNG